MHYGHVGGFVFVVKTEELSGGRMKTYLQALFIVAAFALALLVMLPSTTAQEPTDTFRELLLTVREKQPETIVGLSVVSDVGYAAFGQLSYVGDDYVCVMLFFNGKVSDTESCLLMRKLTRVELRPGIHR